MRSTLRFFLALCLASTAAIRAAEAAPLRAQVARCNGLALEDSATKAVGNTEDLRTMEVQFGYAASSAATKQDELDDTDTVEICSVSLGSGVRCPWADAQDEAWLVFDKAPIRGTTAAS